MKLIKQQSNRRRGITIVEFAVVGLFCLTILLGIFEYSRIVWIKQMMDYAASEGARYAVVHTGDLTTADIQNHVRGLLVGQDQQIAATIQVFITDPVTGANIGPWTDAAFGQGIAVQIDGNISLMASRLFFQKTTIAVQSKSVLSSEAN